MNCWAAMLGGCDRGQSGEHILPQSLFDDGAMVRLRGFKWCASDYKTVPLPKSNILCGLHNNALSEVDTEAQRFKAELVSRKPDTSAAAAKKLDEYIQLDGRLFSRWLTKTHCNIRSVDNQSIDEDFVRYSFRRSTRRRLHFYLYASPGLQIDRDPNYIGYRDYWTHEGEVLVELVFYGWRWFFGNFEIKRSDHLAPADRPGAPIVLGKDVIEEPRQIEFKLGTMKFIVNIWWK